MRILRKPSGESTLRYLYQNAGPSPINLWLAQPQSGNTQDNVITVLESTAPLEHVTIGETDLALYLVKPFSSLRIHWSFQNLESVLCADEPDDPTLSLASQLEHFYLRSSLQVKLCREVVGKAQHLAEGIEDPLDIAKAFYRELAKPSYRYHYPVYRRGAVAMQQTQSGDCGQFSALFVAWCRAVGIPARAVVGTFTHLEHSAPHVWAEFWLANVGWVPVDTSIGNLIAAGRPSRVHDPFALFGHLAPNRFAFSIDLDLDLSERYGSPVRPVGFNSNVILSRLKYGGKRLIWGYELADGTVPYFQPAYPRCSPGWGLNALIIPSPMGGWAFSGQEEKVVWLANIYEQLTPALAELGVVAFLLAGLLPEMISTACFILGSMLVSCLVGLAIVSRRWLPKAGYSTRLGLAVCSALSSLMLSYLLWS